MSGVPPTKIGRLIARRELPVLQYTKEIIQKNEEKNDTDAGVAL